MDGQYWKGDRTMSTNEWLLTFYFWQFLEPWHGRWYEYEIFIASCTDNIYDLENERWLLGTWLIMLRFMDLGWPRVCRRSTSVLFVNSFRPSDAIWWQISRSTLVQVVACCLMAPSHYLDQCWLIITEVQWCSSEDNFAWDNTAISGWN